jgi:hypothetical protein
VLDLHGALAPARDAPAAPAAGDKDAGAGAGEEAKGGDDAEGLAPAEGVGTAGGGAAGAGPEEEDEGGEDEEQLRRDLAQLTREEGAPAPAAAAPVVLDGVRVPLSALLAAVERLGGSNQVVSWRLASDDALARVRAARAARKGAPPAPPAAALSSLAAAAAAQAAFERARLADVERLREREGRGPGPGPEAGAPGRKRRREGKGRESSDSAVQREDGSWGGIPAGLVQRDDGLLHHEAVVAWEAAGGRARDAAALVDADQGSAKQQAWWDSVAQLNKERGVIKGPGVHQPWAQLGAARVSLFRLYAAVMGCGGLLEVVRGRRWPAVLARVDLAPHLKTMLLARRLYATALYPLECRQRCGLLLPPVPPELFATPVAAASLAALPGAAAAAPAAASSQAAARQAVEAGLPTRAGLAAGGKRVWERSAGGWEGETGNARSKRVRRALDSDLPREVSWALGLLAVNSWEAVKGFEPHVELDGPVTAALARLLVRRLRARADASLSGALPNDVAGAEVLTALGTLRNFLRLPHLASSARRCAELAAALAVCVREGGERVRVAALEAVEQCVCSLDLAGPGGAALLDALAHSMRACHSASALLLLHLRIVSLLASAAPAADGAPRRPLTPPHPARADGHTAARAGGAVPLDASEALASEVVERATALLVSGHGPLQGSALDLVISVAQRPSLLARRMAGSKQLVRAAAHLLLGSPDYALEHERAATALRLLLQLPCGGGAPRAARFLSAAQREALVAAVTAEMAALPCSYASEAHPGAAPLVNLAQLLSVAAAPLDDPGP